MTTFSAVVCTKGRPEVLEGALAALDACDPAPLEVLVVDGDNDHQSARSAAERHGARYLPNPPGLTRQRNRGCDEAVGEVVAFFDDDARPARDVFAHLAAAYEDRTVLGATGRIVEPGDHPRGGRRSAVRRLATGFAPPGTFTRGGYPSRYDSFPEDTDVEFMQGAFLTVRRSTAVALRFDEGLPGYGLAEDEDFSCRLSRRGRIRYVAGAVVYHQNLGFGTRDARAFNRSLVVNRWHLFRKNFAPTPAAVASFVWMVVVLFGHRVVNGDWEGVRGLAEGVATLARRPSRARRPPTVCFVSSHSKHGGSERYLQRLLANLGPTWVASVVALENGPMVERLRAEGLDVTVIETGRSGWDALVAARRLRRVTNHADLVHANGVKAAVVSVLAGLPTVWVKHDHSFDGLLARLVARRCRVVVGVSQAALSGVGRARNTKLVPPGVPVPVVDRAAARAVVDELAGGRPVLSLVGRMDPVKGHRDLLAAAPDDARILFIGAERTDAPRATATGWRDDVVELMAGSDVVAVPSGNEGFGLAAAESLSVGTPVVGYAVGSLPEVVGDCGLLVPAGNVTELRHAIERVLGDSELRRRLGQSGPARIARHFSLESWLVAMRDVYLTACRAE